MRKLRAYQNNAIEAYFNQYEVEKHGLIVMPTGSGKTKTAIELIRKYKTLNPHKKVLWFTHKIILSEQNYSDFIQELNEFEVNLISSDNRIKVLSRDINICMIRSFINAVNNENDFLLKSLNNVGLIIIDESHHINSNNDEEIEISYQQLLKKVTLNFPEINILGLTATPKYLIKKKEIKIFHLKHIYYQILFTELVREKYLAKPVFEDYKIIPVKNKENQNYLLDGQDEKFKKELNLKHKVLEILKLYTKNIDKYGLCLMFLNSKENCEKICELIKELHPEIYVNYIIAETEKDRREEIRNEAIKNIKTGAIIINIQIFSEGVDLPEITTIVNFSTPSSPVVFLQRVGRATRVNLSDGTKKEFCYVISFFENEKERVKLSKNLYMPFEITYSDIEKEEKDMIANALIDSDIAIEDLENKQDIAKKIKVKLKKVKQDISHIMILKYPSGRQKNRTRIEPITNEKYNKFNEIKIRYDALKDCRNYVEIQKLLQKTISDFRLNSINLFPINNFEWKMHNLQMNMTNCLFVKEIFYNKNLNNNNNIRYIDIKNVENNTEKIYEERLNKNK